MRPFEVIFGTKNSNMMRLDLVIFKDYAKMLAAEQKAFKKTKGHPFTIE